MSRMSKRVFGILGVVSRMSNWNADFSGLPKSLTTGEVFGSDKALKYSIKKKWQNEGEKILYIKSYRINDKGILQPRNLKEHYEKLFDATLDKDGKESEVVLRNLFSATDVKNFGATFAESKNNISITGAVQIGQGMNKYEDTEVQEQQILSPFRDSTDDDAKSSTLGSKIVSDEAHYFYSFNINPLAYRDYESLGVTEGYTEEDYKKFKDAALKGATSFSTNSKVGCDNEFGLFIETEEYVYLPNLGEYVQFEKADLYEDDAKDIIKFTENKLFTDIDGILKVEVYYNPATTVLEGLPKDAEYYNILTFKKEK